MNELLEKFSAVVVKADNRISPADKLFCENNQSAYEAAISSYQELSFFWDDMEKTQEELLGDNDSDTYRNYLISQGNVKISKSDIKGHIMSLHAYFIEVIVRHFTSTYKVSISTNEVKEALLPEKPESHYGMEDKWEAYENQMLTLIVRYEDVVDQIILRLDGRSFTEQAFYELTQGCHNAAWNTSAQEAKFERKKDTLRFTGYFCSFTSYSYSYDKWELTDGMKSIMRGAAHFEANTYGVYPPELSELMGYGNSNWDIVEFSGCSKLVQIRMFKNGRVDLKFTTPEYAEAFVDRYLGNVA